MKWFRVILFVLVLFLEMSSGNLRAQNLQVPLVISSFNISVATNKTSVLMFPYTIKSVDRGSADILVQKAPGTENVLQVKAARENFQQTNLSVITGDGLLYSFLVDYSKAPSDLNYSFLNQPGLTVHPVLEDHPVQLSQTGLTEKQLQIYSKEVMDLRNSMHGLKDHSYDVVLKIEGIYVKNDRMFFKVLIKNHTDIDYDIEQLRFFIRDQKKMKRTASQESEMKPLYTLGLPVTIKGQNRNTCVIVLPKFTIPDRKYFTVEMSEKNGGRFLHVTIYNRKLMKSVVI